MAINCINSEKANVNYYVECRNAGNCDLNEPYKRYKQSDLCEDNNVQLLYNYTIHNTQNTYKIDKYTQYILDNQ